MEAKTLQIANIRKDEEFETLLTRIMPMIKQDVRYKHFLPGTDNTLKELKVLERVCLEGVSLFLAGLFKMFLGTKVFKKQSQLALGSGHSRKAKVPCLSTWDITHIQHGKVQG